MTYESSDSFTGRRTVRIAKPIVADVMYPPDYFLKKAVAGVKKLGDKIGDTKIASNIRDSKAYQNVAKPILKVAVPAAAAIGLGALAAPLVGKGIQAVQAKKALKTDIVSSVTGAKGTPVVKGGLFSNLKEGLLKKAEGVPKQLKKAVIEKGQEVLGGEPREGMLSRLQKFADARTTPEMLPKTKELKEAEELYIASENVGQGGSTSMPNLQAGGFSISPIAIVGFLLVVVAIGFFAKK